MGIFSDLRHTGSVIRYDTNLFPQMEPRLFDIDWLKQAGHHRGSATGRGEAHFLSFSGHEMVLRPFRRGGVIAKINRDRYLRTGLDRARSMRELMLLDWMRGQGLSVPRPIAAQMTPVGMFYRAAILTERLLGARPFEEISRDGPLGPAIWGRVGASIRQMHEAGVDHSDLNCRNILIDAGEKAWLIDFDKCKRRGNGPWKARNLERLKRSLHKENAWDAQGWARLVDGYGGAPGT
ncbi:MAG: 3-deoxy-D-manno-octulosonic acid kinase [Pseudomonadota bacterium]